MKQTSRYKIPYPEPSDNTQTWSYWQGQAEKIDTLIANTSGGTAYAALNNEHTKDVTVTFEANKFAFAPVVTTSPYNADVYITGVRLVTTTAVTVYIRHRTDAAATANLPIFWIAVSLGKDNNPGGVRGGGGGAAVSGRAAQDPNVENVNATCTTGGCANAGISLAIRRPTGGAVQCGVCGQPITNITARS